MSIKSVVVLTGAGVSAESGIKTFRDADGLWENHSIEDVASIDGYLRNPALVQDFYNQRRRQLKASEVKPNGAHLALATFEKQWRGDFLLVTQNVDDLHDRAGSERLIHMHGELRKVHCSRTRKIYGWEDDINSDTRFPCCSETGLLRPHIVWFGEMPLMMDEIQEALQECDLFISIGTSGNVYPAAGFVSMIPGYARSIEMNLNATEISNHFDEHRIGPASAQVSRWVDEMLTQE